MESITGQKGNNRGHQQVFKTLLDPGLLHTSSHAGPSKGQRVTALDKGKSKATSNDHEQGHVYQYRGRKPLSRINSLTMGTDSPKPVRFQPQQPPLVAATESDGTGTTSSISNSTIESFESRNTMKNVSIRDALAAEKEEESRQSRERREKSLLGDMERRTIYGSKRRRLEREAKNAVRASEPLPSFQLSSAQVGNNSDYNSGSADLLWKSIWERWDGIDNAAPSHEPIVPPTPAPVPAEETKKPENSVEEDCGPNEKSQSMSQHSHISTQSEDGHFRTQFSFYHFDSESQVVRGTLTGRSTEFELPSSKEGLTSLTEEVEDTSRSRIDIGLLDEDDSMDEGRDESVDRQEQQQDQDEVEGEQEKDIQDRIDMLCRKSGSEMQTVRHAIFRGKAVQGE